MRLLLVQLSDIHLRTSGNSVLDRRGPIVRALQNLEPDLEACILLFTGDIAYSGNSDEYYLALDFIGKLQNELQGALPKNAPVFVAAIPGNHDCDFSEPLGARDLLRTQLAANPGQVIDESIIDVGTKVQRIFFELRDALDEGAKTLRNGNKLYYEYHVRVGNELVEIRCLNSAWLSQLHEAEATLHYPAALIANRNPDAVLSLSLLHHPFPWFTGPVRRDLQRKLEGVSDIILTGHEHEESRRTQVMTTGETNQFIEGGALQTDNPVESEFNCLIVDTKERQQRFYRFSWADDMYQPIHEGEWEAFQVNRLRARHDFEPIAEFQATLDEAGAGYEKPGFGRPTLSQIFVYPELRRISLKGNENTPPTGGEQLFDAADPPNLLVSGAEQSGKSALARSVFGRMRDRGFIPVYLDGTNFRPQKDERLHEQLHKLFVDQYGSASSEKFRQLERARRVVIIDSFHKLRLRAGESERFIDALERFAGRVFLFTNDLAHAFGEILRAGTVIEERASFAHYRIMPFGYSKRIELTTRWLTLGGKLEDEQLARRLTEAEDRMEVVLGKNFVPAFPIFLLALLQGLETGTQTDVVASTYGYFYEIFIKATLAKGSTVAQVNVRYTYLTALAWWMYQNGRQEITKAEFERFHAEHVQLFDLALSYREITEDLVDRLVLWQHSDSFGFKYQYFYYYFVARHINVQLTRNRTDAEPIVDELTANLANEEKANVLLFLVHLSPDPAIVDKMIETAKAQFADCKVAKLEEDVAFLNEFASALEFEFEESSFTENRKAIAAHRDKVERETGEHPTAESKRAAEEAEHETVQAMLNRLMTGLKTLQILGQVLKNHPASFEGALKEKAAIECYSLGFRVLGNMFAMLEEGRHGLVQQSIEAIQAERPDESKERVVRLANNVVFGLGLLGAFGIIKRVGSSVGSPELGKTYPKVYAAMPFVSTRLANLSIRLDGAEFPLGELLKTAADLKDGVLASNVLKWLVFSHVNLFPTNFRDRQQVFEAVGITYRESLGANPKRKLLAPGRE